MIAQVEHHILDMFFPVPISSRWSVMPIFRLVPCLAAALALSACATYRPHPLPNSPDLTSAPTIQVAVEKLDVPGVRQHAVDAAQGLDVTDVVTLAVLNNPKLKAKRLEAGVARAQLLQAGLLPNPHVSASFLHPTGGPPPLADGYSTGLTQDLRALVGRNAARASAKAHERQVNLDILWQEWQVAQRARQLFIRVRSQSHLLKVLRIQRKLNASSYRRDQRALRQGNVTLSAVSADLVGLVGADTQLRQVQREANKTWHALDALLGLKPGVKPKLRGSLSTPPLDHRKFRVAVSKLARRRPDLLALRAGYRSQEEAVREAILKQFPRLSVGLTRGSDTSAVHSIGFSVTLSLPLFNHNQGQIAIKRATRSELRQAYQARLDRAVNKAHELWRAIGIMKHQLKTLRSRLPELKQTTDAAKLSFKQGNMSAGTYINLRSSLLAKRVEAIRLRATLYESQAALETLLGMPLIHIASQTSGDAS